MKGRKLVMSRISRKVKRSFYGSSLSDALQFSSLKDFKQLHRSNSKKAKKYQKLLQNMPAADQEEAQEHVSKLLDDKNLPFEDNNVGSDNIAESNTNINTDINVNFNSNIDTDIDTDANKEK